MTQSTLVPGTKISTSDFSIRITETAVVSLVRLKHFNKFDKYEDAKFIPTGIGKKRHVTRLGLTNERSSKHYRKMKELFPNCEPHLVRYMTGVDENFCRYSIPLSELQEVN